ncbi:hypothetical protein EUGRSUZ_A01446 [Eucalyptus grandis]|uniref:Uncharacterized protein n=2 Tax=Eucalyptus grandis TaxID=71139 RepID=A0ACC3M3E9_EUCGR|nr:hypothetical protein EUGRSUZ_A01446 [Eucalyptus grandis]
MALKAFPAAFLASLLIMSALSSGRSELDDKISGSPLHKDGVVAGINGRKVMGQAAMLDYDDPCANYKHEPWKKPGCRNP